MGDCFLLCSDGLNGMLSDDEIRDAIVASNGDLKAALSSLINQANEKGGEDNITAILAKVVEEDE